MSLFWLAHVLLYHRRHDAIFFLSSFFQKNRTQFTRPLELVYIQTCMWYRYLYSNVERLAQCQRLHIASPISPVKFLLLCFVGQFTCGLLRRCLDKCRSCNGRPICFTLPATVILLLRRFIEVSLSTNIFYTFKLMYLCKYFCVGFARFCLHIFVTLIKLLLRIF